jgi:hypothetical protein
MYKRPVSITILGWVFIVVGSLGLASGLISIGRVASVGTSALTRHEVLDATYVCVSGLIAAVGGAGLLHSFKWARWVCLAWMAAHVVLSLFHSMVEIVIHTVMFVAMIFIFFRPGASVHDDRGA